MAAMCRTLSLENHDFMSLYGGERNRRFVGDEDCDPEEYDLGLESGEDGNGNKGFGSSVSLEIYGLQRARRVHFSNQEYYRRLEELKNTHLRNMAELEKMYVSQGERWRGGEEDGGLGRRRTRETRQPVRSLQRINSQEELDLHETSSGSDQSELCREDSMVDLDPRWTSGPNQTCRDTMVTLEEITTRKSFQPPAFCPKPQGRLSHPPGVRVRSSSKVTVPKPFTMMQREEDRKRQKVRTRSEIELENTLLKRELEELRECRKTFRASPAPAHIHLPLYDTISRRSSKRRSGNRDSKVNQASAATSPEPFHFLERERRKREAKVMAELGKLGQEEERRAFKARPMPGWAYGTRRRARSKTTANPAPPLSICTTEREVTEGQSDPNSDPEPEAPAHRSKSDTSLDSCPPRRRSSSTPETLLCDVTHSKDIRHI